MYVFFLLLFAVTLAFENEECDKLIRLKKREVKQLLSPNHPKKVPARSNCRWTVVADPDRTVVLVCPFYQKLDIHAPEYEETCNRKFTISPEGGEETYHCQERGFYEIGVSDWMFITYENQLYQPVDGFTCYIYGELQSRRDLLEKHSSNRRSAKSQRQLPKPKEWELDPAGIELTLNLEKNDMKALIPPSHPEDVKGWSKRSWFIRAEFSSQITIVCPYTDKPPEPLKIQVFPCYGQFTVLTKKHNATYHCNEKAFTHYTYSYKPNVSMIVKYENLEGQSSDDFTCFVYSEGRLSSTKEKPMSYNHCDHAFNLTGLEVGEIKSPNYPNKTKPYAKCRWTVVTPVNSQILIKCTEPQALESDDCVNKFDLETAYGGDGKSCINSNYSRLTTYNWTVITYINSNGFYTVPFRCQAHVLENEPVWEDPGSMDRSFQNPNCDHAIALRPRVLQEFHYPVKKNESEHLPCRWIVVAPPKFRIVFVCHVPEGVISELLPCRSIITISTEDRNDTHHCIDRTFSRTVVNNRMAIFYPEEYHHPSPFHTCHLYAEEKVPYDKKSTLTLQYASAYEKCDKNISLSTNDDNELFSPNYPNDEPPGSACRWIVTAPAQSRIILRCLFLSKPLPKGETCKTYFKISTEGESNTTYCTNESFQRTSSSGWMAITYENLSPSPAKSFDCGLYSELESPSNECENCSDARVSPFSDCDQTIQLMFHDVKELTLNGKEDKPGTSCRWTVVAPYEARILLSCPNNNETTSSCKSQFTVTTPGSETRFCRNKNFAKFSVSYWMIIMYKNPSADTLSPFKCFVYTERKLYPNECGPDCPVIETLDYRRCDNTIHLSETGQSVALTTPYYPNDVPPAISCRWRVHSPNFTVVALSCPGDDVKGNNDCKDYLTVYQAGPHEDPVLYCRGKPFVTNSTGDEMIITYGNQYGLSRKPFKCFVTPMLEKCHHSWQFPHLPYNTYYHIQTPYWESTVPPWSSCDWLIQSPEDTQLYLVCNYEPATEKGTSIKISATGDQEFSDATVRSLETSFTEISVSNRMTIMYNVTETSKPNTKIGCWVFVDKSPPLGEECNCGNKFNKIIGNSPFSTGRIYGGKETLPNEYPMMAGLCRDRKLFCGATIISDRYALTAAHCLSFAAEERFTPGLLVGAHRLDSGKTVSGTILKVTFTAMHPEFNYTSLVYDVGIVGVESPIHFNEKVSPVCMPFFNRNRPSFYNEKVVSLGWGVTQEKLWHDIFSLQSDVLLQIDGHVENQYNCENQYAKNLYKIDQHMCVKRINKTMCKGDSGGPTLWKDPRTGLLKLLGIHSSGRQCGDPNPRKMASIESKVIFFLDWIEETLPNVKFCKVE